MTADSFGFSVGLFDFSDIDCSMFAVMKTETWKHIGTIARSLAARLVAAREEFTADHLGEGSGRPTGASMLSDGDAHPQEGIEVRHGNKGAPRTQRQGSKARGDSRFAGERNSFVGLWETGRPAGDWPPAQARWA